MRLGTAVGITTVKVGALRPSGPFGRYGPVEGGPGGGPGPGEGVGAGVAAVAAGEVEGYGGAGGGGGGPGGVGTPRIRVTALGGRCCAPLPVTQACNIGKRHMRIVYVIIIRTLDPKSGPAVRDNSFTLGAHNVSISRLIIIRFKAEGTV